jgi:hypothetical protein
VSKKPQQVSLPVVILSLALVGTTAAAVVFGIMAFSGPGVAPARAPAPDPLGMGGPNGRPPMGPPGGFPPFPPGAPGAPVGDGTLEQKGTIAPKGEKNGTVYYPIPFAFIPNLTIKSAQNEYRVTKQDENSFSWVAPLTAIEDFTWEAKGLRIGSDAALGKPFEQQGEFKAVAGEEGEVNFPLPYAVPPNVELSGNAADYIVIKECNPTGFKWKHTFKYTPTSTTTWKAKGVRAKTLPKEPAKAP